MKQFWTIFSFELKSYLKNKVFIGVTLLLIVGMVVVMFFPRIAGTFGKEEKKEEQAEVMLLTQGQTGTESQVDLEMLQQIFAEAFSEYEVKIEEGSAKDVENQVSSGKAQCAFVFENMTSYHYYVDNLSMYDTNTTIADEVLQQVYQQHEIAAQGVPVEKLQDIFQIQITHEITSLGKDQMQNFFYTYIMVFALYMVILLYGQMVATNVATEKSSRAMELLVTSAKPTSMMFGKVFASCTAGLIQLILIFGSAMALYQVNQSYWEGNLVISSIFDMPPELVLYMLIFFVLGFFIYAFLYGAVGSMASKVEDINTSSMPITFLFIVGFMVVIFSMTRGNVDNLAMVICSYVPFTSPMAMFTRIAMSTVPVYEIIISIVLLIISVFGIGFVSAKIYRKGVLLYGTPMKISALLKKG